MELSVTNPYNGEQIGTSPCQTASDVDQAVKQAQSALPALKAFPLYQRADALMKIAVTLREVAEEIALLVVRETGKTIREARAEVGRAALIFQIAGEEARRLHGETVPFEGLPNGVGRQGFFIREPVGIVGAITPWNVPLALAAHKIAPALAGGNAVIFKPAEQTSLSAKLLADVINSSGFPENALMLITGLGEEVGDAIVAHPDIPFISFTGSREVGLSLPARAGFKKVTLELGGNSPVIVAPSANLADAAQQITVGGFAVAGQLCISVQRIIVHVSIVAALLGELVPKVAALRTGDPMDEQTDVGTLIDTAACERVIAQMADAVQSGAKVLVGGQRLGQSGYTPTVLTDVSSDSPLAREEAFAPLVLVMPYRELNEAIALANATDYGLNAGIFTNDLREAFHAAHNIVAGSVMINDVPTFRSDMMPYGGRKQSGLGREGVRFAIEAMTEAKVVCFRL